MVMLMSTAASRVTRIARTIVELAYEDEYEHTMRFETYSSTYRADT